MLGILFFGGGNHCQSDSVLGDLKNSRVKQVALGDFSNHLRSPGLYLPITKKYLNNLIKFSMGNLRIFSILNFQHF